MHTNARSWNDDLFSSRLSAVHPAGRAEKLGGGDDVVAPFLPTRIPAFRPPREHASRQAFLALGRAGKWGWQVKRAWLPLGFWGPAKIMTSMVLEEKKKERERALQGRQHELGETLGEWVSCNDADMSDIITRDPKPGMSAYHSYEYGVHSRVWTS